MDTDDMVCIYKGKLFSVKKGRKSGDTLQYAWTLGDIMLSETSQSQKDIYCMIHLYVVSKVVKPLEAERRLVVARD